jgi:hypothetical protein
MPVITPETQALLDALRKRADARGPVKQFLDERMYYRGAPGDGSAYEMLTDVPTRSDMAQVNNSLLNDYLKVGDQKLAGKLADRDMAAIPGFNSYRKAFAPYGNRK